MTEAEPAMTYAMTQRSGQAPGAVPGRREPARRRVTWRRCRRVVAAAAVQQELDTALADASFCLDVEGAALDQRVLAALDAWLGRYVGSMLASDISGLLQNPAVQIQDMVDAAVAAWVSDASCSRWLI